MGCACCSCGASEVQPSDTLQLGFKSEDVDIVDASILYGNKQHTKGGAIPLDDMLLIQFLYELMPPPKIGEKVAPPSKEKKKKRAKTKSKSKSKTKEKKNKKRDRRCEILHHEATKLLQASLEVRDIRAEIEF